MRATTRDTRRDPDMTEKQAPQADESAATPAETDAAEATTPELTPEERIAALEAEVARCRAPIERKRVGRAAADALFSKPG